MEAKRSTPAFRLAWTADALCQEHPDVEFVFTRTAADVARAVAICRRCLVQAECLAYVLEHGPMPGVWGGTTTRERQRLARQAPSSAVVSMPMSSIAVDRA